MLAVDTLRAQSRCEKIWEAKLPSYSDNLIILLWTKKIEKKKKLKQNTI
jgi:hypothetical protein